MAFNSIAEIIEDFRQGKMVLLVDDEDRENEGDLLLSADHCDAASGVTTGISAADRARTVAAAIAPGATPADLVQPGHIFPLRAREGGVLTRAGHTEAGCDLGQLVGYDLEVIENVPFEG